MTPDLDRLHRLLGDPHLSWLLDRLRRRLESGKPLTGVVVLRQPSHAQRRAAEALLGRRPGKGSALGIPLAALAEILRDAELCNGLEEAVYLLTGSVENRKLALEKERAAWLNLFEHAFRAPDLAPEARLWITELHDRGLLKQLTGRDLDAAAKLLDQAVNLVKNLPAADKLLTEMAARFGGDSHALDRNRPLGRLVVRYAAKMGAVVDWNRAQGWREAWDAVGVVCDPLSTPALTLNLNGAGTSVTGKALALHAHAGEPYRISVRQLMRDGDALCAEAIGEQVFVCENPSVVAAAAADPATFRAPLICLEGQPKTSGRLLLQRLADLGITIRYHGDFDWPGIRIASQVFERFSATSWHFDAEAYRDAPAGPPLEGDPVPTPWDPELAEVMVKRGCAVHEEQVMAVLLHDLKKSPPVSFGS